MSQNIWMQIQWILSVYSIYHTPVLKFLFAYLSGCLFIRLFDSYYHNMLLMTIKICFAKLWIVLKCFGSSLVVPQCNKLYRKEHVEGFVICTWWSGCQHVFVLKTCSSRWESLFHTIKLLQVLHIGLLKFDKHVVDYYRANGSYVFACFLNLSKAFDSVDHTCLFRQLVKLKLPENVVRLLVYSTQTN